MVKALKKFPFYILHSRSIVFVPDIAVKSVLTQQDIGCNVRGSWIAKIQEYDIEIKPTKLVRGNALCKAIAENKIAGESKEPSGKQLVLVVGLYDPWFENISYFLTYGECPEGLNAKQKRDLKLKATKYVIWDGILFKRAIDGTFLRYLDKQQQQKLLKTFHDEACGGHFSSSVTSFKILRQRYYWPEMFKDAYAWVSKCEKCKMFSGHPQLVALPLRPVVIEGPFQQWGLDFVGPINLVSSAGHQYIIIATDYFTKWVEAKATKNTTSEVVCEFIKENILVRFGVSYQISNR